MTDLVNKVETQYASTGADKAAGDLRKVAAAERELQAAEQASISVQASKAKSTLSVEAAMDRYVRQLDPAARAISQLERGERLLDQARKQGVQSTARLEASLASLKQRYDWLSSAAQANAHALDAANAKALKAAEIQAQVQRAAAMQTGIAGRLGIGREVYDARGSAAAFEAEFKRREAAEQERLAARAKSLTQSHLPETAELDRSRSIRKDIIDLSRADIITRRQALDMLDAERVRHAQSLESIKGMRVAQDKYTAGVGLARHEVINLSRQLQDVGVSLYGGQNPMTVLVQQGTQIGDIFASSRASVTSVLSQGAAWAGRFAFSLAGVTTAALAAGGAVAYVALSYASAQREMERSLFGVGRGSGMTGAGMMDAARRAAAMSDGRMTVGDARDATAALTATGRVNRDIIAPAASTIGAFAKISGQELPDAAKQVAAALADPVKGVGELDKSLGFLNDRLALTVKNLSESGDVAGAQRVAFDAYSKAIDANRSALDANRTSWERFKEALSGGASRAFDAAGKALGGPATPEEQLEAWRRKREMAEQAIAGGATPRVAETSRKTIADANDQIARLERKISDAKIATEKARADVAANDLSIAATASARQYLPEAGSLQALVNRRDQIGRLMADPLARSKSGMSGDELAQAFARASTAVASFETPIQKLITDAKLATDSFAARTFAERSNIAAEQARLASLRSSHDAVLAAAEAESARNKLIAEGNRKAEDMRRAANDNLALIGLDPFQRRIKEIEFKYRDFDREFIPKSGDTKPYEAPVVNGFARVGSAADRLATTMTDAASKIATSPYGGLRGVDGASVTGGFAIGGVGQVGGPRKIQSIGTADTKSTTGAYIMQAALARGMDPMIALRVAKSEGLNSYVGDANTSFGPFQLHYGGIAGGKLAVSGLGDAFTRQTGLDARDASTVRQQIDFALDVAKRDGWRQWYGARKVGIGRWDGINGAGAASAPPMDVTAVATPKLAPLASTAGRDAAAARQAEALAARRETLENPMRDATRGMEEMQRATQLLATTFGSSPAIVAAANEVEKLRTQYISQGIAPGKASAEMLKAANDNLAALGQTAISAYQQQQAVKDYQERVQQAFDDMRSMTGEFISGPLKAIAQGEKPDRAFKQAGAQLGGRLIDMGVKDIVKMLFGKDGSVGQGLFGGILGKGFGVSQSTTAATADIKAGIVNVNGAVSGVGGLSGMGGGTAGGGGLFGMLFGGGGASAASGSILAGMPVMFANGGVMTSMGPLPLRKYADGGVASSPQAAIFGEGSMNEAFVPLPDGRSIPVSMRGGAQGGGGSHTVNARGGDVIINGNADAGMIDQIKSYVDASNARLHATISRNLPTMLQQSGRRYG